MNESSLSSSFTIFFSRDIFCAIFHWIKLEVCRKSLTHYFSRYKWTQFSFRFRWRCQKWTWNGAASVSPSFSLKACQILLAVMSGKHFQIILNFCRQNHLRQHQLNILHQVFTARFRCCVIFRYLMLLIFMIMNFSHPDDSNFLYNLYICKINFHWIFNLQFDTGLLLLRNWIAFHSSFKLIVIISEIYLSAFDVWITFEFVLIGNYFVDLHSIIKICGNNSSIYQITVAMNILNSYYPVSQFVLS